MALATAVVQRDRTALGPARTALSRATGDGRAAAVVAVTATFEMMIRLVDGAGLPINPAIRSVAAGLGLPELAKE